MSDIDLLKATERLMNRADKFSSLTGPQQAAFRANLTRLLNRVEDPDILQVLKDLQEEIGESETRETRKLTADDLLVEYNEKYRGYSARQRGAFKAKVSRLINTAQESGDNETADKLTGLQETMRETEERLRKQRILALAKKRQS